MAEIIESGGGKKHGKKGRKAHGSTHVDMTPMVDLACLLLTFFMLTTAFSKPKVMEIVLPDKIKDPTVKAPEVDKDKVVNIIIDEDRVFWYNGMAAPDKVTNQLPTLTVTDFSKDGIRTVLLSRNKELFIKMDEFTQDILKGKLKLPKDSIDKRLKQFKKEDKAGPIVLIKAGENVKYGNLVDIIDEMAICNIARYAIVELSPQEKQMLTTAKASLPPVAKKTENK